MTGQRVFIYRPKLFIEQMSDKVRNEVERTRRKVFERADHIKALTRLCYKRVTSAVNSLPVNS